MLTLGEKLRELRDEADMSLRELAGKIHVSAAFLSDIELGRRHPSEKVLADLARTLGASVQDLARLDTRPVAQDLKRLASSSPAYGYAFRRMLDSKIGPEELLQWVEGRSSGGKHPKKKA
jgi:transcriptional regulator with XRE-family HTH domain